MRKISFKKFLFILFIPFIISFINKLAIAQDDFNKTLDELPKKLKFVLCDETILNYKSFIFETSVEMSDEYETQLLSHFYLQSGTSKFLPLRIQIIKLGIYNYICVTFDSKFTSNQLCVGKNNILNLSDYNNETYKAIPSQIKIELYLFYGKKSLESLKKDNADLKIGYIKGLLKKYKEFPRNKFYYEIMAYKYQLDDFNVDSISHYYEESLENGNKDSLFLINYSNWYYSLADTLYKNVSDGNIQQYEQILILLNKANSQKCLKDTSLENFKSMKAFCLYNLYALNDNIDFEKLKEIEVLLTDIVSNKNNLVRRYKALLLLGNVLDLKGDFQKAYERYEEILSPDSKCDDLDIIKLAKEYSDEVKQRIKQP